MKPVGWKIVNILVVGLLIAYAAVAVRYCSQRERALTCQRVEVRVLDSSQAAFVSPGIVQGWIKDSTRFRIGILLQQVDLRGIEELVRRQAYVSSAQAYTSIDGTLHLTIRQRHPLLRILSEQGHNCYLDSALRLLPPVPHFATEVPLVSGRVPLEVSPSFYGSLDEKKIPATVELLHNLRNFAGELGSDPFLKALIAQIYFEQADEVLLLPRLGGRVIRFGSIVPPTAPRLEKLARFYRKSFGDGWWQQPGEINLKYRHQVVLDNKQKPTGETPAPTETQQ